MPLKNTQTSIPHLSNLSIKEKWRQGFVSFTWTWTNYYYILLMHYKFLFLFLLGFNWELDDEELFAYYAIH